MKDAIMDVLNNNNFRPVFINNKVICNLQNEEKIFYEEKDNECIVSLFWIDKDRNVNYSRIAEVSCKIDDVENFININDSGIDIKHRKMLFEYIDKFVIEEWNKLYIVDDIDKYRVIDEALKINKILLLGIFEDFIYIYSKTKSYSNSLRTYLINQSLGERSIKNVKKKTLIEKGELTFLIDRMNLDNKKSRKDFDNLIDGIDVEMVQLLIEKMIEFELFKSKFLNVLDDYFIKKRLDGIIKTGNDILFLKSTNMKTQFVKKIKESNLYLGNAKILEELWQKFFEENLLHLLFSYQELYPKVELNITIDNRIYSKKPDFIGINHYGGIDIIEIKHHLTPALTYDRSHKNFVMSSDLSKAVMQATNYMDALIENKFTNENISNEIKRKILSGNLNRPNAIIIISSTEHLVKRKVKNAKEKELIIRDFTRIRNSLNNITILTFDEILAISTRYKNNIISNDE